MALLIPARFFAKFFGSIYTFKLYPYCTKSAINDQIQLNITNTRGIKLNLSLVYCRLQCNILPTGSKPVFFLDFLQKRRGKALLKFLSLSLPLRQSTIKSGEKNPFLKVPQVCKRALGIKWEIFKIPNKLNIKNFIINLPFCAHRVKTPFFSIFSPNILHS